MCMKFVVYSSRTRGFDGRIFVVRTVNSTLMRWCLRGSEVGPGHSRGSLVGPRRLRGSDVALAWQRVGFFNFLIATNLLKTA
jgi:hypothetical protein